jgi:microcystin degradation protein MlrC
LRKLGERRPSESRRGVKRILVSECKQEISSFNPLLGQYEDFTVHHGAEIFNLHRNVRSEMAGALAVFAAYPYIEVVPGTSIRGITSGGTLAKPAFRRLTGEFLDSVRAARELDGIYFSLHGSFAAETEPDIEGYLLEETRRIVGPDLPIAVSLDLHGVLTERILANCDLLTVYHTYPHVDFYETGERAARLLVHLLNKEIRPVMARVPIPALVRGDELITATGLFGQIVRKAQEMERSPGGLSAGMFIGNPFTDVPDLGSNALVVTDGEPERAVRQAMELAADFWQVHEKLQSRLVGLLESVRLAASATGRVVLTDAADATSSGASGDSNAILRALVEADFRRSTLAPIVDPPAVEAAFRAGVGARIRVTVGGAIDPRRFVPLPLEAEVVMLSNGRFHSESHGGEWNAGRTAVLKSANFVLVVTSRAVSLYDRSLFLAHGQDPARFDAVIVKSPHCQPQFFDEGAELVLNVDAPGSSSANLQSLGHRVCKRPIFPLDPNVPWTPEPQIFGG